MNTIENICGPTPINFEKIDIASNPDYIFENDPNYNTRQLFDKDGSTVFVNSFIECEHYVQGGWDYTPSKNLEIQLQDSLLVILIVLLLTRTIQKKFNIFNYEKYKIK